MALQEFRTDAAVAAQGAEPAQAGSAAYWICLALVLATAALAARIASFW